jgi:hypothetical protein
MEVASMAQRIIDLDSVLPDSLVVKLGGEEYSLPGDIPVPDYLELARLFEALGDEPVEGEEPPLAQLYELVLELFQRENPGLESLPIGPRRLGRLVLMIYTGAADSDDPKAQTESKSKRKAAGTRSTSRKRPTKSGSSR